jgi:hypothetical protein
MVVAPARCAVANAWTGYRSELGQRRLSVEKPGRPISGGTNKSRTSTQTSRARDTYSIKADTTFFEAITRT